MSSSLTHKLNGLETCINNDPDSLLKNLEGSLIKSVQIRSDTILEPEAIQALQNFQNSVTHLNPLAHSFQLPALPPMSNQHKKLFVGNLPANTSLHEVLELFRQFGRVNEQLSTVKDDNYAFIHYYSEQDAESAQKALNDSYFKNRYIRVQYSTSTGHIKKTRHNFDLADESKSSSQMYNSVSMANLNQLCHSPLTPISQFGNKFHASSSMFDLNDHSAPVLPRPITGRTIHKGTTSLSTFQNVYSSCTSKSLLIPANSFINIHNQVNQLYQLQLIQKRKQLESRIMADSGLQEYRLFRQNSTNLFDLENEAPGPVGAHLIKSNTCSKFNL